MVAETETETQIKNDEKTSVIYGFNPPLQVYQPQVHEFYQEPLISPQIYTAGIELVSKDLNHLAAILHVYAGSLNFMK